MIASGPQTRFIGEMHGTPTFCASYHKNSLDTPIPGGTFVEARDTDRVIRLGGWRERLWRGTAMSHLYSQREGSRLVLGFEGSAVSLVLPPNFVPPGPHYGPCASGDFLVRLDGAPVKSIRLEGSGREVLACGGLTGGRHELEVECVSPPDGTENETWALAGFRIWERTPSAVRFRVHGHPLLGDMRADVEGPVRFSRSVREGRWGWVSLLVPAEGRYRVRLSALGWKERTVEFDAPPPGRTQVLDDVWMDLLPQRPQPEPRPLEPDEPMVLVGISHANTWGQETAEYIKRLVPKWNDLRPHALLIPNEVNPAYLSGALRELECPWVTGTGNHSMDGFEEFLGGRRKEVRLGPAHILGAGMETARDRFEGLLSRFAPEATLRIIAGFQADTPWNVMNRERVRLFYYGHSLERAPLFEETGTVYLRKPDANSYYVIRLGPPHDFSAPVEVERFTVKRED